MNCVSCWRRAPSLFLPQSLRGIRDLPGLLSPFGAAVFPRFRLLACRSGVAGLVTGEPESLPATVLTRWTYAVEPVLQGGGEPETAAI